MIVDQDISYGACVALAAGNQKLLIRQLEWDYSFDIPTYDALHDTGMNIDKAVAYIWQKSVTEAKKLRESGAIRINNHVHKELRYTATASDYDQGFVLLGIGKPRTEGGRGVELPIRVHPLCQCTGNECTCV